MKMFSIRDKKSTGFNTPFFQTTFGVAERSFQDAINDSSNPMSKHSEDYELYYLGEYAHDTGEVTPNYPPKLVSVAVQKQS